MLILIYTIHYKLHNNEHVIIIRDTRWAPMYIKTSRQ